MTTPTPALPAQERAQAPAGSAGTMRLDCLAACLLGALIACLPLIGHPHAYYLDEAEHQFAPIYYSVGKTLWNSGQVPLLTLKSWVGGNLLGEYQYAILNPVALGLFALLPFFATLPSAAAFVAVVLMALFTGGSFFLARAVGVSRPLAFVVAVLAATNNHVFYWYASSWFVGMMSLAFLPWAMAFALRAHEDRWSYLGTSLFTALVATSGWPHSIMALGLFVALVSGVRLARGDWRAALWPAGATLFGLLIAVPAIVPLLSMEEVSARPSGVFNNGFLVPDLGDVLAFTNPFHQGWMKFFPGYGPVRSSLFFVGWFILPVLILLDWRKVRWRAENLVLLLVFMGVLLVATQGPEHLGPARWPFRFILYLHMALSLATLLLVTQAGLAPTRLKAALAAGAILLSGLFAWQKDPAGLANIAYATGATLFLLGVLLLLWKARPAILAGFLSVTTVLFFVAIHRVIPQNPDMPDPNFLTAPVPDASLADVPKSYEFVLAWAGDRSDPRRFDEITYGYMGYPLGRATVNGYSPIGHSGLTPRFCFNTFALPCPDAGPRLFAREAQTGQSLADLMRVDRIVAERGAYLDKVRPFLTPPWHEVRASAKTVAFVRPLPNAELPGTMTFPTSGMVVEPLGAPTATSERLRIVSREAGQNLVVFARTWWPGYRAWFNGQRVSVLSLDGFLVAVDLPQDGTVGELTLSWWPPKLELSISAALLGLGGLLVTVGFFGVFRRLIFGAA